MKTKKILQKTFIALSLIAAFALTGCAGGGGDGDGQPPETTSVNLPETGQTTCYDEDGVKVSCTNTGQDGALKKGAAWPSPRFTPGTGAEADCIADNLTGLMWVKAPGATAMTWQEALDHANNLTLCGFDDWRLPNLNELESLYNSEKPSSEDQYNTDWLIAQGFSNDLPEDDYWSSTTYAFDTNYAWSVVMWNGDVGASSPKMASSFVWPVRSSGQTGTIQLPKTGQTTSYASGDDGDLQKGVTWPGARFTAIGNCVTDDLTGTAWVKTPDTLNTWQAALEYANGLTLCGFSDWRLPNKKELRSLIHYGEKNPADWLNSQGFTDVQADGLSPYWSSTSYASDVELAWYVDMANGSVTGTDKYVDGYVWSVRSGQ